MSLHSPLVKVDGTSSSVSVSRDYGIQKTHGLWFDDADIIFRTGSKAFRVHRSILSARSTVFNDMFSVPQGSVNMCKDGKVTIVDLPDAEMDVYYFFLAIFDASFFEPPPSSSPLAVITSILRLSHKYDVPFLRQRSITHLENIFPLDKERFAIASSEQFVASMAPETVFPLVQSYLEIALLSNVADIQWILPPLYLMLSQYPLPAILDRDAWQSLPLSVQAQYLIFREGFKEACGSTMNWLAELPAQGCFNKRGCQTFSKLVAKYYGYSGGRQSPQPSTVILGSKFCPACVAAAEAAAADAQDRRWSKYPKLLGFSGWDALKEMKCKTRQ